MEADEPNLPLTVAPAAGAARGPGRRPVAGRGSAADERLVHSLAAHIDELRGEVRDTQIFAFVTAGDAHIVADIRRAAAWVAGHHGGVGELGPRALARRAPDVLERLPGLAIAQALGRLHRSGTLGLATFEHPANLPLLRDMRAQLSACLQGRVEVGDLQEHVMLAVVGARRAPPGAPVGQLAHLVERLAARPIGNERDIVAMALELALEPS